MCVCLLYCTESGTQEHRVGAGLQAGPVLPLCVRQEREVGRACVSQGDAVAGQQVSQLPDEGDHEGDHLLVQGGTLATGRLLAGALTAVRYDLEFHQYTGSAVKARSGVGRTRSNANPPQWLPHTHS